MRYRSTQRKVAPCSLSEALAMGMASDGGLFVPESWPDIEVKIANKSYATFAAELLKPFFAGDPLAAALPSICQQAFDFPLPITDGILELFHGPTLAFKDFGARFLALGLKGKKWERPPLVMVATSGDTGGAVAAAFDEFTDFQVVILYPDGGISPRQEKQLTVWGRRVQALAVGGSFDACQSLVKQAFASREWQNRFHLISANSINLGRLLPQMTYFAFASLQYQLQYGVAPGIIIPSGNVGNAVAALWAVKLGFPIRQVVFAHNANCTVPDYFQSGDWQPRPSVATLANAMDVGAPSNFERVRDLFPTLASLKKMAGAVSIDDETIRRTIKEEFQSTGKIWCPHTAVGIAARKQMGGDNWMVVATAHPAKFETTLEPLLGRTIEVPKALAALLAKPSRPQRIQASLSDLWELLVSKSPE